MTGEKPTVLYSRDFTFYPTLAASRQVEQQRIAALDALCRGESKITVATVSALLQRTLPVETLRCAAFEITDGGEYPPMK